MLDGQGASEEKFAQNPSMSKKRKIDAQGRQFDKRWEKEYFFILQIEKKNTGCLLCYETLSVMKECNLRCCFDTKQGAKYAQFSL